VQVAETVASVPGRPALLGSHCVLHCAVAAVDEVTTASTNREGEKIDSDERSIMVTSLRWLSARWRRRTRPA
jgi:hypothetical protein